MHSPFHARVHAVFVPVQNMERSIEWYSKLLGLPTPDDYDGEMHRFRLADGADLFLQRADRVQPSPHPLLSLPAPDIDQAHQFLQENGIEVLEIRRQPEGSTLRFKDPDGNVLVAGDL
jgi:catechol 2,3-dioxygenase-like lactoylglutathione lyase family enzyme